MRTLFLTFITVFVTLLIGCGGDKGTATISFSNVTGTRHLAPLTDALTGWQSWGRAAPTVFQMKLIAAYVAEDIDSSSGSNVGNTGMIYLNNDCSEDIMHCDISAGTAEDGQPMSKVITSYFDFGASSAAVNAALNAQGREVSAGSYKYVRLEFCKYNSGNSDNIQWADGTVVATGSPRSFKRNSCTVNSAVISPALSVTAGSSITIRVAYDLDDAITTGSCSGDDSVTSGTKACFTMPTFTPSGS